MAILLVASIRTGRDVRVAFVAMGCKTSDCQILEDLGSKDNAFRFSLLCVAATEAPLVRS